MVKTSRSIRIDDALWKAVKIHVAQQDSDNISSFIEQSIKDRLKR